MQYLGETKNKNVSFLLHPFNYTQIYNKLKTVLSPESMRIFAKPDVTVTETIWSLEGNTGPVLEYKNLSDEEKDELADTLEQQKEKISRQLTGSKELAAILSHLFIIPGEDNVKALRENNIVIPVLTQWGCKSNLITSSVDPLSAVLLRPRATTDIVKVLFYYTTGTTAINKEFYIEYYNRETKEKTNNAGEYNRGRCKLGSSFIIYEKESTNKKNLHHFAVEKGKEYKVVFPYITTAIIQVVDQKKRPLSNILGSIHSNGIEVPFHTDTSGIYIVEKLEAGKEIEVHLQDYPQVQPRLLLTENDNSILLQVTVPEYSKFLINVVDENGNIQPNYPLLVKYNEMEQNYATSETGELVLEHLEVGKEIQVTDKNKIDSFHTKTISEDDNQITIVIQKPLPRFVKVRFLDSKNQPLINIPVDFMYNGQIKNAVTDDNGICTLPYEGFVDREKVKTIIHLPKKEKTKK